MPTEYAIVVGVYSFYQALFRVISPYFCRHFLRGYGEFSEAQKIKLDSGNSSLCNTIIVYILSIIIVFGDVQQWNWGDITLAGIYSCNSIGYFLSDLHTMAVYRKEVDVLPSMFVHHIICIIACHYILNHQVFLYYFVFRNLSEIVQPFFHLRFYLRCLHLQNTKPDQLVGFFLTVSFFLSRIIIVPLFWIQFTGDEDVGEFYTRKSRLGPIFLSAICIGLDMLNLYWFRRITAAWTRFFRISKLE